MAIKVKKRNKRSEEFDVAKLERSIKAASESIEEDIENNIKKLPDSRISKIANDIKEEIEQKGLQVILSSKLSDIIENKLMETSYKEVAKKYITYHYDQEKIAIFNTELMKQFEKKLRGSNIENSNANCDERSFSGRMNEAGREILKEDALNNVMSKTAKDNHQNNEIYTHDLDSYSSGMHNCLSIPFDKLFEEGAHIKQTDLRPPKSISTAMQQVAVYMQVQSLQQFGGVASTHLDWTMIPSVRYSFFKHLRDAKKYLCGKDWIIPKNCTELSIDNYKDEEGYQYAIDMTVRDTRQGAEALIHNLNSLQSRSGQQLPFSSINYGTCTLTEGRMVTDAILNATLDGTGPLHKTPIFPCGIFQYHKDINGRPGTPNYDLFRKALLCTSKRFYPNYTNCHWSVNVAASKKDVEVKRAVLEKLSEDKMAALTAWVKKNPKMAANYKMAVKDNKVIIDENILCVVEIMSTMGCRTYNGYDANFDFKYIIDYILKNEEAPTDYLFSGNQKDGRGNIAPATIILPTIAMKSKGKLGNKNIEDFFNKLLKKIEECRDGMVERFTHIASQNPASAMFMYHNRTMLGYIPKEGIISALKHGTLAMGQIGMAETLQILIGKDHTTEEGMALAKRIESLFNQKCAEYKSNTYNILGQTIHLNFGVYYTPAESLCHTALKKFRDKYGVIPNVSDKDFFTNSIHIPVWVDCTPFEKIDYEAQLTGFSNAGCITYVEIDTGASQNLDALEQLVVYAMDKDIPYLGVNLSLDTCRDCGWSGEINDECPACKSRNIQRLRRFTGYITEDYLSAFNAGKIDEVHHRVKHHGVVKGI